MIKVNKGSVHLEGGKALLQAELSCVVKALNESFTRLYGKRMAKEMLMEAVDDGFKTTDEIKSEFAEFVRSILDEV